MHRSVAIAGITASLLGGALVGATVMPIGVSGAQDAPAEAEADAGGGDHVRRPGARIARALAPLIADGTITEAQGEAVVAALVEAGQKHPGRPGGPGHPGRPDRPDDADKPARPGGADRPDRPRPPGGPGAHLGAVAEILDLEVGDIVSALRQGESLADVAAANGSSAEAVIDAMVAKADAKLAEAVAAGHLTEEEAAERRGTIVERITAMVNGEHEGRRPPGHRPGGPHGTGGTGDGDGV